MRDREWSRAREANRARSRIWQHVSPAAASDDGVLPLADALLQLPTRDIRLLQSLHLLLAPETNRLVQAAPALARQLRTSTTSEVERRSDRVRGPVDWPATFSASLAEGRRYAYATRPSERDYSTPENRLLVASLRAVVEAERALGWQLTQSQVSRSVRGLADRAAVVLGAPSLRHLVPAPEDRDTQRVERGRAARRFEPVTAFWRLRYRLDELQDIRLLRDMVERTAVIASTDGALLEVLVLFDVLDALRDRGWTRSAFHLIRGQSRVRHTRGREVLDVHYQGTPHGMLGRYESVLRQHAIPIGVLRPDIVLDRRHPDGERSVTLIEVKYRRRAADAIRSALLDLLAYRDNYADSGLTIRLAGVGWGASLEPQGEAGVLLCTPDKVSTLIGLIDQ